MRGWLTLVVVLAAAGCEKEVLPPEEMDPVSEEEAAAFARTFEAAVEPCDAARLQPLLHPQTVFRRAARATHLTKRDKLAVYRGMMQKAPELAAMLCDLGGVFGGGFAFELVRIRQLGEFRSVLFRTGLDLTTSYVELELGKSERDRKIRILDVYAYYAGERISDHFAAFADNSIEGLRRGIDPRTSDRIVEARDRRDHAEVQRLMATLPAQLLNSRQGLLWQLSVAPGEVEQRALKERIERAFPDHAVLGVLAIDLAFARRDVVAALRAVDRLDQRVGGDPYLELLRADGYLLDPTTEHLRLAEQALRRGLAALPEKEALWRALVDVQVRQGDRSGALATLTHIEDALGSSLDEASIAADPAWQAFLASPEYQASKPKTSVQR